MSQSAFQPLFPSQTPPFLFRVVYQRNSHNHRQLQMRELNKAFDPLFSQNPLPLSPYVFDHHLSNALHGEGSTPFTSWFSSYSRAVALAEKYYNAGVTGIEIFVIQAPGLQVYDGEAVAQALGYDDGTTNCGSDDRQVCKHEDEFMVFTSEYSEPKYFAFSISWIGPSIPVRDGKGGQVRIPIYNIPGGYLKDRDDVDMEVLTRALIRKCGLEVSLAEKGELVRRILGCMLEPDEARDPDMPGPTAEEIDAIVGDDVFIPHQIRRR